MWLLRMGLWGIRELLGELGNYGDRQERARRKRECSWMCLLTLWHCFGRCFSSWSKAPLLANKRCVGGQYQFAHCSGKPCGCQDDSVTNQLDRKQATGGHSRMAHGPEAMGSSRVCISQGVRLWDRSVRKARAWPWPKARDVCHCTCAEDGEWS